MRDVVEERTRLLGEGRMEGSTVTNEPTHSTQPTQATPQATPEAPATLAAAAEALRAGTITSAALTETCLARIAAVEPEVKACVTVLADQAHAAAEAADRVIAAHRAPSSLAGIPLGIKDLIETAGIRTTAGSRVLDDYIPTHDASIYTRLRDALAVPIAKTNTHEFAFGTVTPPTRNPWNLAHVPGGSSGGSAAGLVAGEFLGALGTDTGGSIRIPAAWCGVTGLKPTFGLVGRAGIIPLSFSYDHAGPMARTVEDCALMLDVLAGYDADDPNSVDVPLPSYVAALEARREPGDAVRGSRIGLPTRYFFDVVDAEVAAAVRAAADVLASLGATLVEVAMPPELTDDVFEDYYRGVQRPEAYTYHADQGWLVTRADRYSPTVRANIEAGAKYSAADYIRAQAARHRLTRAMRATLAGVDALLAPTVAVPAPPVDAYDAAFAVDGKPIVGGSLRLTLPFNLTGQPALALPCGFTRAGLPIGMQLAARHFGEPTLLRLGHAYQRATDWHTRRPAL